MLIGNHSVLHKSPVRFINGREALLRSNFSKHGMIRNAFEQFDAKSAIPYGHLSPSAWVLPKTAGGMSSRNVTGLSIAVTGLAYGGVTSPGTASITFTVADAAGQLISSGTGSASMTFTVADALLTASLNGEGSASFTITTNTPLLGALAGGTGTASMVFAGTLLPYAIGSMSGSTVDNTVLTTDALLAAMNAAPPSVNVKKVNDVTVNGTGAPGDYWGP